MAGKSARKERNHVIVRLWKRQRGKCYLCGRQMALRLGSPRTATIEHMIPKSRHYHDTKNTKAACYQCNQDKGNLTAQEYLRVNEEK